MDRVKIKENAKAKIKGNLWNILWPLLLISVVQGVISGLFGTPIPLANIDFSNADWQAIADSFQVQVTSSPVDTLINFVFGVIEVAYIKYVIDFVRTGEFEVNSILDCLKKRWFVILAVTILSRFLIALGIICFFIPGIIIALGLAMTSYLAVDTDLGPIEVMKKSWEMMKGYKWNFFVLGLSFIGWYLLIPFTLGLLLIWLIPYVTVAQTIYYDELKDVKK